MGVFKFKISWGWLSNLLAKPPPDENHAFRTTVQCGKITFCMLKSPICNFRPVLQKKKTPNFSIFTMTTFHNFLQFNRIFQKKDDFVDDFSEKIIFRHWTKTRENAP